MTYISGDNDFIPELHEELSEIPESSGNCPVYPDYDSWIDNFFLTNDCFRDLNLVKTEIRNKLGPVLQRMEQNSYDLQERLINLHKIVDRLIHGGVLTQQIQTKIDNKPEFYPFQKFNNNNEDFKFPGIYKLTTMLMALRYGFGGEWDDLDRQESNGNRTDDEIKKFGEFISWFDVTDEHDDPNGDGYNNWLPKELTRRMDIKVKERYDDFFHKLLDGNPDLAADIEKILSSDEYKDSISQKVIEKIRVEVKKEYADTIKKLTGEASVYETTVSGKHEKIEVTSDDRVAKFGEILDAMIVQEKKAKLVAKANGRRFQNIRDGATTGDKIG